MVQGLRVQVFLFVCLLLLLFFFFFVFFGGRGGGGGGGGNSFYVKMKHKFAIDVQGLYSKKNVDVFLSWPINELRFCPTLYRLLEEAKLHNFQNSIRNSDFLLPYLVLDGSNPIFRQSLEFVCGPAFAWPLRWDYN